MLKARLLVQRNSRNIGRVDLKKGNTSLAPAANQPCLSAAVEICSRCIIMSVLTRLTST